MVNIAVKSLAPILPFPLMIWTVVLSKLLMTPQEQHRDNKSVSLRF